MIYCHITIVERYVGIRSLYELLQVESIDSHVNENIKQFKTIKELNL